jgi:pimeloyl-ACP methyl ester carboxylesterase
MTQTLMRRKAASLSYLEGGAGQPMLFLHGIPGSAWAWAAVGERLTAHCRVLIPDLAGFGQSDPSAGDFYLEAQARAVGQLLRELGINTLCLAGHDFGGPVALTLLRLFPELQVQKLVLAATNLFTDTYVPPPLRLAKVPLLNRLFFKAMAGNRLGLGLIYWAAIRQKGAATWAKYERHLTPSGMALTSCIFQRSLADLKGNYQPIENMLPKLAMPTLVLWGSHDPFFAVGVGERIERAMPNATLQIYAQTGHFVPEEQPILVADALLTFLAKTA